MDYQRPYQRLYGLSETLTEVNWNCMDNQNPIKGELELCGLSRILSEVNQMHVELYGLLVTLSEVNGLLAIAYGEY